ncbi:hypothetical protein AB205_0081700 [Aquarana catesbeiana]|uniref:Uncharacterized protein n=1 Tax=Aquarana catesbeiana TaxID=8400 RepID=A0A2G9QKN9_AQUCT|nr:hypothetical protein AB205_0081700 [Aquarana catesbeiana]
MEMPGSMEAGLEVPPLESGPKDKAHEPKDNKTDTQNKFCQTCFISLAEILCKPVPFFMRGKPIPKRMLPPEDLVKYYTDAEKRGYLADPIKVDEARKQLALKYGYILPDITKDELYEMLCQRKDPRQMFFGLAPGWVINMTEKKILKPTDERLLAYYSS